MEDIEYQKMYELEDSHWWFVSKRKFIQKMLTGEKFPKILDIGCGSGKNLEFLSKYGTVWGIDASNLAINFCHQRQLKRIKMALAQKLPFPDKSFNLVTAFDVLYHQAIKNDQIVLKEINRVLKPGGYLLITDCAYQWLYGPHDKAMQARQRYSKKELTAKLKKTGFFVKKASYIFMSTFPVFLINRLFKKYFSFNRQSDVKPISPLINDVLIKFNDLEAKLLPYLNLPFGSSIIILGKK